MKHQMVIRLNNLDSEALKEWLDMIELYSDNVTDWKVDKARSVAYRNVSAESMAVEKEEVVNTTNIFQTYGGSTTRTHNQLTDPPVGEEPYYPPFKSDRQTSLFDGEYEQAEEQSVTLVDPDEEMLKRHEAEVNDPNIMNIDLSWYEEVAGNPVNSQEDI